MKASKYEHIDDTTLLQYFYNDNHNKWLGILLQRYTLLLFGVCMKYLKDEEEAKDCVQQIFEKVIAELQKYQVSYFKSWIYMIAKNYCLTLLRNKGKYTTELNENVDITSDDTYDKNSFLQKDKQFDHIAVALQQLNNEQQQCVTLFYLQRKSYQEIVDITGFTLMQVKSHIQNGKRNLKILIEKMKQ